jgi:hypothetical protein
MAAMSAATLTLIDDGDAHQVAATIDGDAVALAPAVVADKLGWELRSAGLCRGDVCVPVRDRAALLGPAGIDLAALAAVLARPLALDVAARAAYLGTAATTRSQALTSLQAPDFTLPDLAGTPHSLSDYRGTKVLLVAYASW